MEYIFVHHEYGQIDGVFPCVGSIKHIFVNEKLVQLSISCSQGLTLKAMSYVDKACVN